MPLRALAPEASASASFATSAGEYPVKSRDFLILPEIWDFSMEKQVAFDLIHFCGKR